MTVTESPAVAGAIETTDTVLSHLHPPGSFDVADHPVPSGREEIWRFTPMRRLHGVLDGAASDARLNFEAELPEGVTMSELSSADAIALGEPAPTDRPGALAIANSPGAVLIDVATDQVIDEPAVIRLTGSAAEQVVYGHLVIRVGRHSKVTLVIDHLGSARYLGATSVIVGDGADLTMVSLQDWADDAVHLGREAIRVGRDAQVRHVSITFGGDLIRINTGVEYDGPGGKAELLGIYFADAGQHIEHRLFVDHNAPKTQSNVDYKGALQGKDAHTVWIGDVLIRKVAEGINTYESNRNLVLTEGCRADSVPNLEIETGEIEGAGHASTTGRFDDEQLFYLQTRGIPAEEAKRLVVRGFFADIIHKIGIPSIEEKLIEAVEQELARSGS